MTQTVAYLRALFYFLSGCSDYDREQFAENPVPLLLIGTKFDQIPENKRSEVLTRTAFLSEDFNAEEINLVSRQTDRQTVLYWSKTHSTWTINIHVNTKIEKLQLMKWKWLNRHRISENIQYRKYTQEQTTLKYKNIQGQTIPNIKWGKVGVETRCANYPEHDNDSVNQKTAAEITGKQF